MDEAASDRLLKDFGRAFFRRDLEGLTACTTEDFEWRFAIGGDDPHGRVYRGVDGVQTGFAERDALLAKARYDEVRTTPLTDGRVLMEYRVSGAFTNGKAFDFMGVEIFAFRDGRIALKDVYWKQHAT
jgi:ketosteroid isomerase-like protein